MAISYKYARVQRVPGDCWWRKIEQQGERGNRYGDHRETRAHHARAENTYKRSRYARAYHRETDTLAQRLENREVAAL